MADSAALESPAETLRSLLEREPDDATSWFSLGRTLQEAAQRGEVIATADFTVDKNFPVVFRSAAEAASRNLAGRS